MKPNPIITYWREKAWEDIASAEENFRASRLSNAVRDAYYACFPKDYLLLDEPRLIL